MYSRSRTPASQLEPELDPTTTPASAKTKTRRKSNSDGLLLTKSGRVSMITNEVNAKYDASYRNSDNTNKLLGRSLSLGQACGLIGVALYGADIPLEDSGSFFLQAYIAYSTYSAYFAYFNLHCLYSSFGRTQ
jgi:hypothetical protein